MLIRDVMSRHARTIGPEESLRSAAELMRLSDIGFLPVVHHGRLVGALTDRDLVIRGLAEGLGPEVKVEQVMSEQVVYGFDDETVTEGLTRMEEEGVRRLLVLGRKMELLGVVSIDDLAAVPSALPQVAQTLAQVS